MNDSERTAFLIELHRLIEDAAYRTARALVVPGELELTYPPNGGLRPDEVRAISALREVRDPALEMALRKVFADAEASVVFHLLNLVSSTGDPEHFDGSWGCYDIVAQDEDEGGPMFHEEFYETYWQWRDLRDESWRLDNWGADP